VWQRLNKNEALLVLFRKYMKIVTLLYIHLIILAIYVILFRELPSSLQSVLTFALSIVVFINRKVPRGPLYACTPVEGWADTPLCAYTTRSCCRSPIPSPWSWEC
jgi:hypothetical protein